MKFPIPEINIDEYLDRVKTLLNDNDCHVFIDTNIISQLYRLNDKARADFYKWINELGDRFHIPVWAIHEYSNRVLSGKTKDYLAELNKIKTYKKEIRSITDFIKGYVGDSLLKGTAYENQKGKLFTEIDSVNDLLGKISAAINNKLTEHQSNVHKEIIQNLEPHILTSNIYDIMDEVDNNYECRFNGKVPPGFEDYNKEDNNRGDLIIWNEILIFSKSFSSGDKQIKAIWISRDKKKDMMYIPNHQTVNNRKASEGEQIHIAHEGLVYEFKINTKSSDLYLLRFDTLVKIIASEYRDLAKSFQIATQQEHELSISDIEDQVKGDELDDIESATDLELIENEEVYQEGDQLLYLGQALLDSQYAYYDKKGSVDGFIAQLKSYNWYIQNPAIEELKTINIKSISNDIINRSSFFVLGRNLLQSADGAAGAAISFIENLAYWIKDYPIHFQKAIIDGLLYEIFFNSNGKLRSNGFKAFYLKDIMSNIDKMKIDNPYGFINHEIDKRKGGDFAPTVGDNKKYTFNLSLDDKGGVKKIICNDKDITNTFPVSTYGYEIFARRNHLNNALSYYYAILEKNIDTSSLDSNVEFICKIHNDNELLF